MDPRIRILAMFCVARGLPCMTFGAQLAGQPYVAPPELRQPAANDELKLDTWLDAERGRATRMAAHFNRSLSAVSQWRTAGVPRGLMKEVRDFTGGEVSLEEMLEAPDDVDHAQPAAA